MAGAFVVAVWDGRDGRLILARDRLGIAPLFYAETPDGVVVGSTEAGVLAHPLVDPVVTVEGLRDLFGYDRTPGRGLWDQVREVEPGKLVTVDAAGAQRGRYWALAPAPHAAGRSRRRPRCGNW